MDQKHGGFLQGMHFLISFSANKSRMTLWILLWNGGLLQIHVIKEKKIFLALFISN